MQDYAQFISNPAKMSADFATLASLRYAIHFAVAQLEDPDDLRALLGLAQAAGRQAVRGNSPAKMDVDA